MKNVSRPLFLGFLACLICFGCWRDDSGSSSNGTAGSEETGTTAKNLYERHTYYSDEKASVISGYSIIIKDSGGRVVQYINYTGSGKDGIWDNLDDIIHDYGTASYDTEGHLLAKVWYCGAGPDREWFTADDSILAKEELILEDFELWRYARRGDPGADRAWSTPDDMIYAYDDITYDPSSTVLEDLMRSTGEDGKVGTADDEVISREVFVYDSNGLEVKEMRSEGRGDDGKWFTADDVNFSGTMFQYNIAGKPVRDIHYGEPSENAGMDSVWMTGDDIPVSYDSYVYDANGYLTTKYLCQDSGVNGTWFDTDDIRHLVAAYTYDEDGKLFETDNYRRNEADTKDIVYEQVRYSNLMIYPKGTPGDSTPPHLTASSPADKAVGVSVDTATMTLTFSEDIVFYRAMLTFGGFTGLKPTDISGGDGNTIRIDLSGMALEAGTTYSVTMTGLMDRAGNIMPAKTVTFETGGS